MNAAQIHLLFNHFPIIGTLIGIGVVGYALLFHEKKILDVGLCIWALMALLTFPVKFSGEGAEEIVEPFGVNEALIETHEDAGAFAFYAILALGALSLVALFLRWRQSPVALPTAWAAFVLSLVVAFMMYRAGSSGGAIRHPEVHQGTAAGNVAAPQNDAGEGTAPQNNTGNGAEKDDD